MKLRVLLAASILAMFGLSAPVMANTADEATLLSLEQQWADMSKAKDIEGLRALIDDAYVAYTPSGKESKADMLNPPGLGMTQNLSALSAIVEGDRAAVSGDNLITFASGKSTLLHFVDQFERKGGRWRVVASYVTD